MKNGVNQPLWSRTVLSGSIPEAVVAIHRPFWKSAFLFLLEKIAVDCGGSLRRIVRSHREIVPDFPPEKICLLF
jgi:hypothetical protein